MAPAVAPKRAIGTLEDLAEIGGEGAAELTINLFPDEGESYCGTSWEWPLSHSEKVRRLVFLFEADREKHEQREEALRLEKEAAQAEAARAAARLVDLTAIHIAKGADFTDCRSPGDWRTRPSVWQPWGSSPPSTPPTPPPAPRLPRATAPPMFPSGRRRSSVVVLPKFPSGFDPQADSGEEACLQNSTTPSLEIKLEAVCETRGTWPTSALSPPPKRNPRGPQSPFPASYNSPGYSPGHVDKSPMLVVTGAAVEAPPWAPAGQDGMDSLGSILEEVGRSGTVTAIRWGGSEVVDWLHLVTGLPFSEGGEDDGAAEMTSLAASGDLSLDAEGGEYVKALRGRAEITDGRAADWAVVVTSRQELAIGQCGIFTPTFSFAAEPGHELYSVVRGPCGRIIGARQRPLHPTTPRAGSDVTMTPRCSRELVPSADGSATDTCGYPGYGYGA
eukprot:TRINITY_DN121825_c0_g1_i1.p1 TRINITY_DN121825_c0_g1~~TRINITY_DN121825_c0_g1_i1.p1  ORF type:complete len:446 (+),score=55.22 TRINITY_DN121825_c0_g1_i1:76-1413(+)